MASDESIGKGSFPPTRWTLVQRALSSDDPEAFQALSQLCEAYWYPLYVYVRSQGAIPSDAADEVQGFFEVLLEKDFLESVDRQNGKLRSFLIDALKKFRAKKYRAQTAQKRGGGKRHLSIDQEWAEGRFEAEVIDLRPDQILDRSWASWLLDRVTLKLQQEFERKDQAAEFKIICPFLAWNSGEGNYAGAAQELGITVGNLKVKVHRMRNRYRELLEETVRETLEASQPGDVEQEIKHLIAALS